ncbi:MAG: NRDE family protein [Brumimicrobium sp.]|nr:NRDE family protein [Brumimicrobium sp.]MCO5267346.1 NRDE family protein [Brumimicrobium sp.]
MCTVTYFPLKGESSFIVTHNRDEASFRKALAPQLYEELGAQLYYAKDTVAGGTWMGVSSNKQLVCLMNGAFSQHKRKVVYRLSRGIVVKELLASDDILSAAENYNLGGIEQFYALLFTWKHKVEIYELVWDGEHRFLTKVDETIPHIWSSAMLYPPQQRIEREKMLAEFMNQYGKQAIQSEFILQFHQQKEHKNGEGIVIDRGFLKTTSISQFHYTPKKQSYFYHDLSQLNSKNEDIIFDN